MVPLPPEEYVSFPGAAFIAAISAATEVYGLLGLTIRMFEPPARYATGAKSSTGR
ncbi:Uncharacterised protein [Bordetella pertussis]|nr:Uncharacterised protein [Bordetella pertussis]CPL31265.1 Uncharacterised protein [Bordetella pertussis]CPN25598.1 Uncharacterised protein [Bordetella pertussis]